MKKVYAPGCALMVYKPALAKKVHTFLQRGGDDIPLYTACCRHAPPLPEGSQLVNTCAGCDRRFRAQYAGLTTISLWEVLAEDDTFPFPDYGGQMMTVQDACPTRTEDRVHIAIRRLLERMNISVRETDSSRATAVCCGDSFYGVLPVDEVKERMRRRAEAMPVPEVVVYCVSCIKSMHIGGKTPRYIVDLLFGESTEIGTSEPDAWHAELNHYIENEGNPEKVR
ncbi:MAG: (Fe-S)-binding protein [Firmicutes bacterium]|nr:(Fe-S)-binding protein [Dethiobacter sp.]MBS3889673.1 (Fe-S)-binding protein [Bacillota bacterium]MBS4054659.1 (Fe-S)-binding protein [Thermaerobacter sp.]MBS4054992.1 (Fe-S)-binding protein [Thermaerobacter sp.]